ncbi:unnamed protein product [Lactuca saligna]|uniref:BED-type domain-containing protein n=1 Tax=Lactuca saligna TaxID=75948 RepID=A0AA35ZQC8_LACSI|nr:unnamed protein product [Lactuca saligna]
MNKRSPSSFPTFLIYILQRRISDSDSIEVKKLGTPQALNRSHTHSLHPRTIGSRTQTRPMESSQLDAQTVDVDAPQTIDVDLDVDEGDDEVVADNKGGGHRVSWVWQHFDRDAVKKGAKKVKCPYCSTMMCANSKKNGTSAIGNHLRLYCPTSPVYDPKGKVGDTKKQSVLSFKKVGDSGATSLEVHSFSQEKCRNSLARMCIKDNQPFSIVEDEGFREYSRDLQPLFKLPSRWTVARDCLQIYKEEMYKLKDVLKNQTVSITTDTWTSIQNINYSCLTNWGIEKVFTVTVDNASSNDGAIRFATFLECVEKVKINCSKKPSLDVDTRWNSTFLMLETAEKYEAAFDRLLAIDSGFKTFCGSEVDDGEVTTRKRRRNEKVVGTPDADDWEVARYFIDYLRIFYNVTKKIFGSKYVTANIFFKELVTMQASITRMCASTDEKKKKMAKSMKEKYDKYWDNIENMNFMLHIVVVLDPRNKMCYLEYCLELIYGKNSTKTKTILEHVNKTLEDLFQHFKNKTERERCEKTRSASSSTPSYFDFEHGVDMEDDFERFMEQRGHGVNKTELEIYLSDGMEKRAEDFQILGWWKSNSTKFPVLSEVAKLVLGMPISTVASESAFSTGGRVIDESRSSLTHVTAEALICAQDWIRDTPIDIQFKNMTTLYMEETREKLVPIETEELGCGQGSCMDEDFT